MTVPASSVGECSLLHVDMDAFYASVVTRDRPELRDVPVVVGGGHRGVVVCANYPARALGIDAGMAGVRARRRCPGLVEVPADFRVLVPVSRAIMTTLRRFTPVVEVVSLDEAFLDVRGAARLFGSPHQIAEAIRARVREEHRITCSVGIAATVSVAKLASRRAKPDGVLTITPAEFPEVVHPLGVGELYGVGPATRDLLHRCGVVTVGDLVASPIDELAGVLGRRRAEVLQRVARGADRRELRPGGAGAFGMGEGPADGSMGAQRTLAADTWAVPDLEVEILRLAARVGGRMRRARKIGRVVVLTVRFSDFTTISRARTLPDTTDLTSEIAAGARRSLRDLGRLRLPVRLVGVRVAGLRATTTVTSRQLALGERDPGWWDADRTVDRIAARFGDGAISRASLLATGEAGGKSAGGYRD